MAEFSLRKMAAGGMYDHVGGGFHRYSVDDFWHVPHFEKVACPPCRRACRSCGTCCRIVCAEHAPSPDHPGSSKGDLSSK